MIFSRNGHDFTERFPLIAHLLHELPAKSAVVVPRASALAYLQNPKSPTGSVRDAARTLGIKLDVIHASAEVELDKAFEAIAAVGSRAIIVEGDPFFDSWRERIIALATHHSVVGCYPWREYAVLGGLMSYGSNLPDAYRQSAHYVGRILKGAKPADLPVERPDKFELVVNLKTAENTSPSVRKQITADLARERRELAEQPAEELQELTDIYIKRGVEPTLARKVAEQLSAKDAFTARARDELSRRSPGSNCPHFRSERLRNHTVRY